MQELAQRPLKQDGRRAPAPRWLRAFWDRAGQTFGQRVRNALATSVAAGLGMAVRSAIGLAVVPVAVRYLGRDAYGAAVTLTAAANWLLVLDGGFNLSLKNALVQLYATRPSESTQSQRRVFFASAFWPLLGIAAALALGFLFLALRLPLQKLLNLGAAATEREISAMAALVGSLLLLALPLQLVRSDYSARQQEYRYALWTVLGSVLGGAIVVASAARDLGFVWMGSALVVGNCVGILLGYAWYAVHYGMPRLADVNWSHFRKVAGPGLGFLAIQVASIAIFQTDVLLSSVLLGPSAAGMYRLHIQLLSIAQMGAGLLVAPFWPALGEAACRGEREWFEKALRRLSLIVLTAVGGYAVLLTLLGPWVMRLWTGDHFHWNVVLGGVLAALVVMRSVTSVFAIGLGALGVVKDPAVVIYCQALANLALSIWWGSFWGLTGIALASLGSYCATSFWYVPWKLRRVVRTGLRVRAAAR